MEGVTQRRVSRQQELYEAPLPQNEQRARENVVNAPWAIDVERLPATAPLPAAIFSNPAMRGPAVAFAPPPPPPREKPRDLPAAPDALHGIGLAPLRAEELPRGTRTDLSRAFTCGAGYKLYPETKRQADGSEAIVYWTAVNVAEKRAEFVIGPDSLSTFTSNPKDFSEAAIRFFWAGEPDKVNRESGKVVDLAMREGFGAAFRQLGRAWTEALKDPHWVASTVTTTVTSLAGGSTVGAAVAKEETRTLAATRARQLLATAQSEEPAITNTLKTSVETSGGRLVGLDARLKSEASLVRKVNDRALAEVLFENRAPAAEVENVATKIHDAVRYTVCADAERYTEVYRRTVADLESRGFKMLDDRRWNAWHAKGYRGLNTTFVSPNGQAFEVQFHTFESFAAKTEMHVFYEEWRAAGTPVARQRELEEIMDARYRNVTVPPGALSL